MQGYLDPKLLRLGPARKATIEKMSPHELDNALYTLLSVHAGIPLDLVQSLIHAKANPNGAANSTCTPLKLTIMNVGQSESRAILRLLLSVGASPNLYFPSPRPLVQCALYLYDDVPTLALELIKHGATPILKSETKSYHKPPHDWYYKLARMVGECLLTKRAVERALAKTGKLHKDVIPLISGHIWNDFCNQDLSLDYLIYKIF